MLSVNDTKVDDLAAAILASSPDCVKVLSSNGTLQFVNASGLRLMGASSLEEVYGKNYAHFWPADRREDVLAAIRDAAAGESTSIEGYCPTLTGEPRWWESHFSGVASEVRGAVEVVGITRDISARRYGLRHQPGRGTGKYFYRSLAAE